MNEHEFQQTLAEIMSQISTMSEGDRERLEVIATETRTRHERMKKTIGELQESLDYLRLSVKYLVFDLEATRRENQYLRKILERHQSGGRNEQQPENPENE